MRKAMMVVAALCSMWISAAAAQGYPSKPLRLVVAFPAGGPIDIVARMLQPKMG